MSFDDASRSSELALESTKTGGEFRCRKPKISYTTECLLSLAELDDCKDLPGEFDQSILSELCACCSAVLEQQHLQGKEVKEPFFSGGMSSSSSKESADRWDSNKLRPKESNSTDSGRWYCNRYQCLPQNSGNAGIFRSSLQEHSGILGSWSSSKLLQDGSEESAPKFQGAKLSLLSRCSEPYRPPAFYKATIPSGGRNLSSNNETLGTGEDHNKERVTGESWRKVTNEELKAIEEKQESRPEHRKEDSDPDAQEILPQCYDETKASVPMHLAVSGSIEPSDSTSAAAERYLKTESPSHTHLPQVEELFSKSKIDQGSEGFCYKEKSQGQHLEGGQFPALLNVEEVENIASIFPDKNDLMVEGDSFKSQSKFVKWFSDSDKAAINISSWDDNGKKAWGEATGLMMDNSLFGAIRAPASEVSKASVAEYESSRSVARDSLFPSMFNHDRHHFWESQLDKFTGDPSLEATSGACVHTKERSKSDLVPIFGQEADSNLEIHLPDEDSLITIDETYIFQHDIQTPSPTVTFKGGRSASSSFPNLKLFESEKLHQNLNLREQWSPVYQRGTHTQILAVNPSDSEAHLRPLHPPLHPWKIYPNPNGYNALAADPIYHPFQIPAEPQRYEPSIQHFPSPRMQHAENFYPFLGNPYSPEPFLHHKGHHASYRQPEPSPLGSDPFNYQSNLTPTPDVGKRAGLLTQEGNKSAFCHLLQMQMRLAQMNLEAAPGTDERVYGKTLGQSFR